MRFRLKIRKVKGILYLLLKSTSYVVRNGFSGLERATMTRCRIISGKGNSISLNKSTLTDCSIKVYGKGNRIIVKDGTSLSCCTIYISGENNSLVIDKYCRINDCEFWLEDDCNEITLGAGCSIESGHLAATEGRSIDIGADCMMSNDIEIRTGDSHAIFDRESGCRINDAKDVLIGSHVWLCAHVRLLKGSNIADGIIIGNSALVSGACREPNSIYGGSPVKCLKTNINWTRERKSNM